MSVQAKILSGQEYLLNSIGSALKSIPKHCIDTVLFEENINRLLSSQEWFHVMSIERQALLYTQLLSYFESRRIHKVYLVIEPQTAVCVDYNGLRKRMSFKVIELVNADTAQ